MRVCVYIYMTEGGIEEGTESERADEIRIKKMRQEKWK